MSDERVSIGTTGVTLHIEPNGAATVERRPGTPDVYRFFTGGPAVIAASVNPSADVAADGVSTAAGKLVAAYHDKPRYSRTSRMSPDLSGATESTLLDFQWEDDHGVLMHSVAIVAADSSSVVVVHGSLPELHGDSAFRAVETIVLSCEIGSTPE